MTTSSEIKFSVGENEFPLSIGFDAKRAFYNSSGLGNYSRNLLSSLAKSYPENSYYLFTPCTKNLFPVKNDEHFRVVEPGQVFRFFSMLWRRKFMNREIKRFKLDIFHGLSQELPLSIEKSGAKSVVTVHDLIFMRFPEYYRKIDAKIYYSKLVQACNASDHIVAMSNQTKNDIIEFLGISHDKISVIYQGCNSYFWNSSGKEYFSEIRKKYKLPGRYLLYVGTIEERKNLLGIIKAMHIRNIDVPLVVIGRKTDNYFKNVRSYIISNNMNNVIFPDSVLNSELPAIYQNADCFIYPSFFEGFGIPLLEALVSGTPVITSKGGCFKEAAGPGSKYIDPHDPEQLGEAIAEVTDSRETRDKMISAGKDYANNFRDDIIAGEYMSLYRSLLQ